MKTRTAIFIVLCALIWTGKVNLDNHVQPKASAQLTIRALNGTDRDAENLLNSKTVFDWTEIAFVAATMLSAGACYGSFVSRALCPKGM